MNILIIEDELLNANRLQRMLTLLEPECVIVGVLESIAESVAWLQSNEHPDLIMMDIRIADGVSFEIFEKVDIHCPVIFTTAYDEYAIRAFKVNSVDYIMKPVEEADLQSALTKFKSIHYQKDVANPVKDIIRYLQKNETLYRKRFLLPFKDGYRTIQVSDIDFIFSESKITNLVLTDRSVVSIAQTMEELEEQLDPKVFFRSNRQSIVSLNSIGEIHNYFNGKLKLILKNDPAREVLISKVKTPLFKSWLDH